MRNVILVRQEKLQRVLARGERHLSLCLAATEMEMLRVVGNGLVERRQIRIDQKMVVPRVKFGNSRRRDTHALQTEVHDRRLFKGVAILDIDEIDGCACGRRGRPARRTLI